MPTSYQPVTSLSQSKRNSEPRIREVDEGRFPEGDQGESRGGRGNSKGVTSQRLRDDGFQKGE